MSDASAPNKRYAYFLVDLTWDPSKIGYALKSNEDILLKGISRQAAIDARPGKPAEGILRKWLRQEIGQDGKPVPGSKPMPCKRPSGSSSKKTDAKKTSEAAA